MPQQMTTYAAPAELVSPRRRDVFLHLAKTGRLIGALTRDTRISPLRKILFFGAIFGLLAILLFPDFFNEVFLSVVLPFLGTILGIPLDAGFDWLAFALAFVSLLHIFPAEIVSDHYQRIFNKE